MTARYFSPSAVSGLGAFLSLFYLEKIPGRSHATQKL